MTLKNFVGRMTLAAAIAVTPAVVTQAQDIIQGTPIQNAPIQDAPIQGGQIIQGSFQQGETIVSTQQPTEEDLAKADIGAVLYDAGIGVGVRSVFTNGPAQKAGLQSGDMITKINGEAVQNVSDFNTKIGAMISGDAVKLTRSTNTNGESKEDEVSVQVMTRGEVLKASTVAEPGAFDSAVSQAENQISMLEQQIKNAEADLVDMKKRLADQQTQLVDLKAKAAAAKAEADAKKAAADAKKKADEAAKQKDAPQPEAEGGVSPAPDNGGN